MRALVDDTDRQQREVYAAEDRVGWSQYGASENLGELEDVWEYVYRLMRRQSFARRYPKTHSRLHIKYKMKPERIHEYGRQVHVLGVVKDMDSPYRNMTAGLAITPKANGGCANGREMSLSRNARQKWYVIHELAHVVDYNENGRPDFLFHQGHGWQFCSIYLNLVGMAFGADAKKELRECFKNGNVRYLRPRGAKNLRPNEDPNRTWVV